MKLSDYARKNQITYTTAYKWFKAGQIPNAVQMPSGTILIHDAPNPTIEAKEERVVLYARVSNASRRKEIEYQVTRLSNFCSANGYVIDKTYKEVASGMNDTRKQLWAMIDSKPTKIVVENKDRLTRFGFTYLEKLLKNQGTEIIVINKSETDEQDLIRDLVSIITSFCCRLYGLRRGYKKAKAIADSMEIK